jgi:hypothetical protein
MSSDGIEAEGKSTERGFGSRFGNFRFFQLTHSSHLFTTHLVTLP